MPDLPSILPALDFAIAHAKRLLFSPFNKKKWLCLALPAVLVCVGEGGTEYLQWAEVAAFRYKADTIVDWITQNTSSFLSIMTGATLVACAFYILYRYINSRARFMLMDYVITGQSGFSATWNLYRQQGNALMKLRIYWDLAIFNVLLLIVVVAAALAWPDFHQFLNSPTGDYDITLWSRLAVIFLLVAIPLALIFVWLAACTLFFMAIPLMFITHMPPWPAYKYVLARIFFPHLKSCLLYLLMMTAVQIALVIAGNLALLLITLLTCLTGYLLYCIPVLNVFPNYLISTLILPLTACEQTFALRFMEQFTPNFKLPWPAPKRT